VTGLLPARPGPRLQRRDRHGVSPCSVYRTPVRSKTGVSYHGRRNSRKRFFAVTAITTVKRRATPWAGDRCLSGAKQVGRSLRLSRMVDFRRLLGRLAAFRASPAGRFWAGLMRSGRPFPVRGAGPLDHVASPSTGSAAKTSRPVPPDRNAAIQCHRAPWPSTDEPWAARETASSKSPLDGGHRAPRDGNVRGIFGGKPVYSFVKVTFRRSSRRSSLPSRIQAIRSEMVSILTSWVAVMIVTFRSC
jgi:hypothetical protein